MKRFKQDLCVFLVLCGLVAVTALVLRGPFLSAQPTQASHVLSDGAHSAGRS